MQNRIEKLQKLKASITLGGGEEKLEKQRQQHKLTARERIAQLLDSGTFVELNMLIEHAKGWSADGMITGYGKINGRYVCVYSEDATVLGGSQGRFHGIKAYKTIERAIELRVPFVGLHDGAGGRIMRPEEPDQYDPTHAWEEKGATPMCFINTQASGTIPQITALLGSCAGGSVYSPALTDFTFMVEGISHAFVTGPQVVKSVIGEDLSKEQLGGAKVHSRRSGVCDFRVKSDAECLQMIRRLLSFLPSSCDENPPKIDVDENHDPASNDLCDIVPSNPRKPYDMREVIHRLVDRRDFLEVKPEFAPEIIVGFGRLNGNTVGVVANQPLVCAGCLTVDSSVKEARFIRFCDCFNIPLVFLADTPGYMPGSEQEHRGIIRHGAKVLYALAEATVPRVTVAIRKVYGGGNVGMAVSPGFGTDLLFAWPSAEIGVLGAEAAVELFFSKEIKAAANPEDFRQQKIRWYREQYTDPLSVSSKTTHIHDVIEPQDTRLYLVRALEFLRTKKISRNSRKKHGNIPL